MHLFSFHFSYTYISLDIYTSLFMYIHLFSFPLSIYTSLCIYWAVASSGACIHRSLFIHVGPFYTHMGLFSYTYWSSFHIYIGLFSYIYISFHICVGHLAVVPSCACLHRSLFIHMGLYLYKYGSLFIYKWVSFHTCTSLFIFV